MAIFVDVNEKNPTERPLVTDGQAIAQMIEDLMSTRKGERLFDPEYGLDLQDYLFDLMDEQSGVVVFREIRSEVRKYLPIVEVMDAQSSVIIDPDTNAFYIDLAFIIKGGTGQVFNVKRKVGK